MDEQATELLIEQLRLTGGELEIKAADVLDEMMNEIATLQRELRSLKIDCEDNQNELNYIRWML